MITTYDNYIHPTAIIENVEMGYGNYIGPYCVLKNCTIGNNNCFEAFCSVGTPPEHKTPAGTYRVEIGNNNVFKEFITINTGAVRNTVIANNVWMLTKSHVGHDAVIHDNVTLSCYACVGGHAQVFEYVNMGLHAVVHQYVTVPPGAMLGMGIVVPKKNNLEPFCTYAGSPAAFLSENNHLKQKLDAATIKKLISDYEQAKNCLLPHHA